MAPLADAVGTEMTSASPDAATTRGHSRGRTPRGEGGRLRADILTAAAELLDHTGDEQAVTLRAVARRVGVSAPALYAHFSNRQEILLAVVSAAFDELTASLSAVGPRPEPSTTRPTLVAARAAAEHLQAVCQAYLDFAVLHPQRYRVMFGGVWSAQRAVEDDAMTPEQATDLGRQALEVFITALEACVWAGASASTDTSKDATALWLGLHGLAHQRAVIPAFPWPDDIADRLIGPLARFTATSAVD